MSSFSSWNPGKGVHEASRRRSQRVILSLPITVRVEDTAGGGSFEEVTTTLVVNAHGALIALAAKVEKGQTLRLTNRSTREHQLCHVVYVGKPVGGKTEVGIEFKDPAPEFWHIVFPPEDWASHIPASGKGTK